MDMWHVSSLVCLFGGFDWQCWDSQCELATESRSAMDPWQFSHGQSGKIWLSFFQNQVGICHKTVLLGSSKVLKSCFFCCCLFICEICCDYVFGSPLKNWDRLLLYFRLPALRRLLALSRGLGLPIPKPFRAPFIPGITVRTERRNGRRWDNGEVCSAICNVFFEGRSLVQRENYPLMEGVMTLYRVMGSQVHVEIAGFLGLLDDVN